MLNGRVYRAACLPLLFALAIAGFSLSDRPGPLGSNLAPEAFQGARAQSTLEQLAARYPDRRPGSAGDDALAQDVAGQLRALGGSADGGFAVAEHVVDAETAEGSRALRVVVARRPGTTGERPIAIVAHRDAVAAQGRSGLAGTAILLELARVFSTSETHRGIVLVSTSGGSGGDAGARAFASHAAQWAGGTSIDAAIVVGDLGGSAAAPAAAKLQLGTFAQGAGVAPELLQRTVSAALSQQAALAPSGPSLLERLAQLSFPLAGGEQAPLDTAGIPAVLLQAGGELPAPVAALPAAMRLEGLGRATLSAVYALDAAPGVASAGGAPETALALQSRLLPEWAMRLLVATALLPPLLTAGDGLARQRRRRRATAERPLARSAAWVAACALPFLAAALFAVALAAIGAFAAPQPPVAAAALPLSGSALAALLAVAFAFALAWFAWPAWMRRLGLPVRPPADPAGLALLVVLDAVAVIVWASSPYTALLLLPALHLWLALAEPGWPRVGARARAAAARLALVALGAVPLVLLVAFYASRLALGPLGVAHTALLLLASGRIGLPGAVLWSLALGCLVAAALVALAGARDATAADAEPEEGLGEPELAPIRGPMSYAGPGSLGGTESALRR